MAADLIAPSAAAWSSPGTGAGVLVLHGFTGNPTSVRPLAERIAAAGYRVEAPRLPGHGTNWRDLAGTSWDDWAGEVEDAFDRLGDLPRVAVGLSMGGALALHLAQERPDDVAGLVLINPFMTFRHPLKPMLGVVRRLVPSFPGVGNDIARPGADELPYDRVPLSAAASLFAHQDVVRARLHEVRTPTLLCTSRTDHTVDPQDSTVIREGVRGRTEQVWLSRSFHVATMDYDAELIVQRTLRWIAATTGVGPRDEAAR